uniref:Uncharacterized protein n=1 Tax=Solanum tuberosum TaxID=4113 RepID=M1BHM8_SOLTU
MTVGALQDGIDWSENERMFFTSPAKGILQLISSHLQSSNYNNYNKKVGRHWF